MDALKSANQLWRKLQSDAGLEIRRKNGAPGRDADVEDALKDALDLTIGDMSLDIWLDGDAASADPHVSVEKLLVAVLASQQGYAAMMRDMLDLLISANASRDDQTLGVQFQFDKVSDPIRFTLEAFREAVLRTERVLASHVELPPATDLWALSEELGKLAESNWSGQERFLPVAPAAKTGHAALDGALETITELVEEFRAWCSSFGVTRQAAYDAASQQYPDRNNPEHDVIRRRIGAAHDLWDVSVLDVVEQIAQGVGVHSINADDAASKLIPLLASLDHSDKWTTRTYTELLDLLNLPTWRKRHELFSVWAGSILLRTAEAEADSFRFLVADGVLSFAFGGSRLATYDRDGEQFDIWAELRSPLVGRSFKRKKGIQPDFRVLCPSLNTSLNTQTRLVLECKHYLAPRISNFSQAAADYARSCPNAAVLVVNHGPIDNAALEESIDPSLRGRTGFIGDATAIDERHSAQLGNAIRRVIFPPRVVPQALARGAPVPITPITLDPGIFASIRLRWDATLDDADLALEIYERSGMMRRVDFRTLGDLANAPFARLDRDQRQGPGEERIDISAWYANRYVLIATNYTGTGEFGPGHLDCIIALDTRATVLNCPVLGGATEWRIATIEVVNGTAQVQPFPFL